MRFLLSLSCCLFAFLNADVHTLRLRDLGCVRYLSDGDQIRQIQRISKMDEVMYTCSYDYDETGKLISERLTNELGKTIYKSNFDPQQEQAHIKEPYISFHTEYDSSGNLIRLENKRFVYDEKGQLIKVITPENVIEYSYDSSGKRISRRLNGRTEYYIYHGINELARLDEAGNLIELRVPGVSPHKDVLRPVAIETPNAIYVPVQNLQGTITAVINIATGEEIPLEAADYFGRGLDRNAPTSWIFSGKYYDREAGLVYFGVRHYSPEQGEWLTPDPMKQSSDPYLYCLGDPLNFIDPDGQFAIEASLVSIAWGAGAVVTAPIWTPYAVAVATGATIGYWGYKGYEHWKDTHGNTPSNHTMDRSKKGGIDPTLPKNPFNHPDWKDISHSKMAKKGHYRFRNNKNGDELRLDIGDPRKGSGHKAHDHYHRITYNRQGGEIYLDKNRNPVPQGSEASHLYPPEWVWW